METIRNEIESLHFKDIKKLVQFTLPSNDKIKKKKKDKQFSPIKGQTTSTIPGFTNAGI